MIYLLMVLAGVDFEAYKNATAWVCDRLLRKCAGKCGRDWEGRWDSTRRVRHNRKSQSTGWGSLGWSM